jgi:hypothetical protein
MRMSRLELVNRKAQRASRRAEPSVIAGKRDGLPLTPKKIHRRQMERVEDWDRLWKGLQRSREHLRGKLDKSDTVQQGTCLVGMRPGEITALDAGPKFVFEEPARNQRFLPELLGRRLIFRENTCQRDRSIEIDQRSLRSSASWLLSSRNDMTDCAAVESVT